MSIEPWQIPILVMALIAGPAATYWALQWLYRRYIAPPTPPSTSETRDGADLIPAPAPAPAPAPGSGSSARGSRDEVGRALVFAVLTVALVVMFFAALGEEVTNTLTVATTAVTALVPLVLGVHSVVLVWMNRHGPP